MDATGLPPSTNARMNGGHVVVQAQQVGVDDPAWQVEGVELPCLGVLEVQVDRVLGAPLEGVEGTQPVGVSGDQVLPGRDQDGLVTCGVQMLARASEFDLLNAVGAEDRDAAHDALWAGSAAWKTSSW